MSIELRKSDNGAFHQNIRINQHTIFADSQNLLAAMTGLQINTISTMHFKLLVKIITLMTYAKNKNIPFGYVDTDLESDTVQEARGLYFINVKLKLFGKLNCIR